MRHLIFMLLSGLLISCNRSEPSPEKVSDADRVLLEQLKQKEQEKIALLANPDPFIVGGKWEKFDKGIINDYTQVTGCEFTNNSKFAVTSISGNITVYTSKNVEIGSIPFNAEGVLLAGETKTLKINSGELSGKGERALFTIKSVKIIGD